MGVSALRCQTLSSHENTFKSMRSGLEGLAAARAKSLQLKIGKTKAQITVLLMDKESRTREAI